MTHPPAARFAALGALLALLAAACSSGGDHGRASGVLENVPKGCEAVDIAVSPEKVTLLTDLARSFNNSDAAFSRSGYWSSGRSKRNSGSCSGGGNRSRTKES